MTVEKNSISFRKQNKNKMKKNIKLGKNQTHSTVSVSRNVESSKDKPKNCHQCRHFNPGSVAVWCMNQRNDNKCPNVYCSRCLINRYGEETEKIDCLEKWCCPKCRGICNCSICMKRRGHEPTGYLSAKRQGPGLSPVFCTPIESREIIPDKAIVPDKELTSVVGIAFASEQVGNALQFLEFCAHFGKILDFKKGEPEYVLQDLLDDQAESRGKFSAAVQFHIYLLRIIQKERGEEFAGSLSNGKLKGPWFDTLKKFLSGSQSVLKAQGFDCFDNTTDYDTLDSSKKLILLNILCDEVLETKKVKNWVGGQSRKVTGKNKDTSLKRTRGHDIDNAVIPRYQPTDTLRIDPVFKQQGHVFWKLNAMGESDILCQSVEKGDVLTLDEKWSSVNAAAKEAIEKHISLSREQTN